MFFNKPVMPTPSEALKGGNSPVHPNPSSLLDVPGPAILFGLGCFWGVEKLFTETPGVTSTSVGYAGGYTPNPTYREVCTGRTGHAEVVRVVYDPEQVSFEELVKIALEAHDPTQGYRQGNDVGTQYRSCIFTETEEQADTARAILASYAPKLKAAGFGDITTEIRSGVDYYLAEEEHQQYLRKNPGGYCPVHATGIACG
ncbi:peptide-methionine (S)-S-oxide reductase MsrA [Corynebacterium glucuronolyticum]|uniref:Peptide methionine sulfoxide reductase MsrA n=2 Tax=Corynebacterium glucuronolyticum TaxID=39791 RepID=A0AAX1L8F7_9CORY|nr:peptide-methionine (S)-S-oxide reductase MsrA [Corynebacterium glucuronolyticum]EEI61907.1 peptide-methionine (S)-S-oxide reductase [Corynebacterium glucuronolyticum ATCC 51866]MCT1443308.1 peptide-methionine (S)-S-oxide reductase MsrA [Corynebacterium glucuronolyticum]MCT1564443.1 peptide-methionine (S)-S-oxide reductase MsrA [Corynebacterium glucuronolyticum]QQU88580.1 peptide-methionine (S)-S-oxide reductase MsrA [Corynebacterium glucuronolyticum]QRP70550.1 peptide-methionine (S)-S-oxide